MKTQPDTPSPVFTIRNLTKTYTMGEVTIHALRGVSMDLFGGELVVLLGASGSGKSTLINILGGLDFATAGDVIYDGWMLTGADDAQLTRFRRHHIGFVFQFYNLIPSLTARENVAIVTEISRDPMTPEEALNLVGLADRMDHFPSQMSGGEQQRTAIASAIAKRPAVLMCDEPTGALDSQTGVRVLEVIHHINAQLGTTTVIITHNEAISRMADRVIRIGDGRIIRIVVNADRLPPREITW